MLIWRPGLPHIEDMRLIFTCALFIFLGIAQEHMHSREAERQAVLMSGLGNLHHPVSTRNPEAQRFFDQGLALIYGFNHEEARLSFQRAAELDPQCAMAWWGVALAVGPNYNDPEPDMAREKAAWEAIQKARAGSANATPQERGYIDALAKRYSGEAKPDLKQLAVDYHNAMRDLATGEPADLDAATLAAESAMDLHPWQLWSADGKPTEGTPEIVATLQSVLRRDPSHIGANHFLIHALEASPHPEQARAAADRLAKLAPEAGHLVHMPGHIYMRIGDYQGAAEANVQAAAVDRKYIDRFHVTGMYPEMYYSHNLHFLAIAAAMEGRFAAANKAAAELSAKVAPVVKDSPMVEPFLPTQALVLVRFHHWDDVLKLPEPDASAAATRALWHFARGMAYAEKRNFYEADAERESLLKAMSTIPDDAMLNFNRTKDVLNLATHMLEGRISMNRVAMPAAIEHFRAAAKIEDALAYDEPPAWYIPARESLGRALMTSSRFDEAEKAFREDLAHHARNPRALFGLWQSLKEQGKKAEAKRAESEFRDAWKNADVKLVLEDL